MARASFQELRAKTLESSLSFTAYIQSISKTSWLYFKKYPESDHISPYSLLPSRANCHLLSLGLQHWPPNWYPCFCPCPVHHQSITHTAARIVTVSKWKSDHVIPLPKTLQRLLISLSVKAKVLRAPTGPAATGCLPEMGPTSDPQNENLNFNKNILSNLCTC